VEPRRVGRQMREEHGDRKKSTILANKPRKVEEAQP
jgi:hypothetical protein